MKRVLAVCGTHAKWEDTEPYQQTLRAAGLEFVVVRPDGAQQLEGFGGLLLIGGSDVNPARYGEDPDPQTQPADDARDAAEAMLIAQALEGDAPLLAICRGLQMLNVQQGGTLIQHLDDNLGHRVREGDRRRPVHEVEIMPGTKLAAILGEPLDSVSVNSRHHQAASVVGDKLVISARSKDGVIEGLERPDKEFVIAVQWHPENQAPKDPRQARIFEAFANAIGALPENR